jgi:hypothetical protein
VLKTSRIELKTSWIELKTNRIELKTSPACEKCHSLLKTAQTFPEKQ